VCVCVCVCVFNILMCVGASVCLLCVFGACVCVLYVCV
jgi:hypothetical protein